VDIWHDRRLRQRRLEDLGQRRGEDLGRYNGLLRNEGACGIWGSGGIGPASAGPGGDHTLKQDPIAQDPMAYIVPYQTINMRPTRH